MQKIINLFQISLYILIFSFNSFGQSSGEFVDKRDGKKYSTIKIGSQIWIAENMAFFVEKGCWPYNNDSNYIKKHGYLYNWEAAQNICPDGWKLPSKEDFEKLLTKFGGEEYPAFKELIEEGSSGFCVTFGGWRNSYGHFNSVNKEANFWTSTIFKNTMIRNLHFVKSYQTSYFNIDNKKYGASIRCLKK